MPNDVFEIYQLAGHTTGTLGLCKQPQTDTDFTDIAAWHPSVVVSLTKEEEFPDTNKPLPVRFLQADYHWLHLPITDFDVPPGKDTALWQASLKDLQAVLNEGGKVLIHCKGGKGRSGMMVLKLLVMQGEDKVAGLQRIRSIRAGAVETDAQHNWAITAL